MEAHKLETTSASPARAGLNLRSWILPLLSLVIVLLVPRLVTTPYNINLLTRASAYAIAVLGLTVLLGYTGQISLTQAAFLGIGGYTVALLTTRAGFSFWLAVVAAVAVAIVFGLVLGMTTIKLGGHYLAMITICFQLIFFQLMQNWKSFSNGGDGIGNIPRPWFFGVNMIKNANFLYVALFALWLVALVVSRLKHTRLGRAMRAVRENELAAETTGVDTIRTKVIAFTISAALAGLGGALYASAFRYISPEDFRFDESVTLLAMVLIGGSESMLGSAMGAFLLIFLPEWLRDLKKWYLTIYGFSIIVTLVFMPEGLWGYVNLILRHFRKPVALPESDHQLRFAAGGEAGDAVLEVQGLVKHFGGIKAVDGIDFAVRRGEIHALIGPNGSGKTTVINLLSGLYVPSTGSIRFLTNTTAGWRPNRITKLGMARTFQNIRLFRELTVWENVLIGSQKAGGSEDAVQQRAKAALEFIGHLDKADELVKNLPYGHQKVLEIARALAGEPELLLLDEPAAGLNHTEKQEMVELLQRLHKAGLTMLLVEHDMSLVAQVTHSMTVLNFGKKIAEGSPDEVLKSQVVIEAYLGREEAADA